MLSFTFVADINNDPKGKSENDISKVTEHMAKVLETFEGCQTFKIKVADVKIS